MIQWPSRETPSAREPVQPIMRPWHERRRESVPVEFDRRRAHNPYAILLVIFLLSLAMTVATYMRFKG
jgi:hypothetical protein